MLVPTTAAPAPLGSEGSASPASPSPRSLECFEDLESWYDDFEMVCDSESEMVCEEEEDELDCEGEMSEHLGWVFKRLAFPRLLGSLELRNEQLGDPSLVTSRDMQRQGSCSGGVNTGGLTRFTLSSLCSP